jgi:hypothetical protein
MREMPLGARKTLCIILHCSVTLSLAMARSHLLPFDLASAYASDKEDYSFDLIKTLHFSFAGIFRVTT